MVILAMLAGVFKTRAATLWGEAVDFGVVGNTDAMLTAALGMLIFVALDSARTAAHYTVIGRAVEGMFRDVRMSVFHALSGTDSSVIENHMRSGDIALRACEDTERLCDIISGNYAYFMRLIFMAVFAVAACIMLSWRLSAAYFIVLPISLFLLNKVSKPLEKLQTEARGGVGRSADIASGALSGIHAVKVFGMEAEMDRRFARHVRDAYERFAKSSRIGMGMTTIKYIVSVLQTLILFAVGAWLVSHDLITIGAVMAFVALAVFVTEAFGMADRMIFQIKSSFALAGRVYEIIDLPQEQKGKPSVVPKDTDTYVHFDKLTFAYEDGQNVLSGLDLKIEKGQKIAIVGPSGSGKSTIIKLICRIYGYDGGKLSLFGEPGEELNLLELRSKLALVTQEPSLFEESILENVRYGRATATDDEVIEALKAADLWNFICTLPDSVHTKLGEFGSRLSGGQRQRLSIARALVKNAELVLLDEATSALDTQSEREIQQALDRLLEGRTAVIVAHRLTTVQRADYLYCMKNGAVIEEGPPEELFAKGGYYYEMCKMQMLGPASGQDANNEDAVHPSMCLGGEPTPKVSV